MSRDDEVQQKRDLVGDFFEGLSAKLFGGEVQSSGVNNEQTGAPDIINSGENQVYEVKSTNRRDWAKIQPEQVGHYRNLRQQESPLKNPEVYYMFWSYQKKRTTPLLIRGLQSTLIRCHKAVLILSLDIVEAGLRHWPRSGSKGWPEYCGLTGTERRKFFKYSGSSLSSLSLDPEDYVVKERKFRGRRYLGEAMDGFRGKLIYHKSLNGLKVFSGNVNTRN